MIAKPSISVEKVKAWLSVSWISSDTRFRLRLTLPRREQGFIVENEDESESESESESWGLGARALEVEPFCLLR